MMTMLTCRNVANNCLDTLSAADPTEIQKVFLDHVHTKHSAQWNQFTQQFRAVALVTLRNRFRRQMEIELRDGLQKIVASS
jgi:hypothetical protein